MSAPATLSKHRPRKFWGWGYDDDQLTPAEQSAVAARTRELAGRDGLTPGPAPKTTDFDLRKPRIAPLTALASRFSTTPHDRLLHAYGRSFPDILRMWMRDVPHPPDLVAFPETEDEIATILDWAGRDNIAVIPFGGGSSVVGGVEPAVGNEYAATISLDLERFDKMHEIDRASRAARIGAGIYGPALEDQLRPHGLTLRHYPQSFQFSTLGGWIVTRSGGHYATAKTHIDDFVESTRMVTPSGIMESRRLPGSGGRPRARPVGHGFGGNFGCRHASLDAAAGPAKIPRWGVNSFYRCFRRCACRWRAVAIGSGSDELPAARSRRGRVQPCRRSEIANADPGF